MARAWIISPLKCRRFSRNSPVHAHPRGIAIGVSVKPIPETRYWKKGWQRSWEKSTLTQKQRFFKCICPNSNFVWVDNQWFVTRWSYENNRNSQCTRLKVNIARKCLFQCHELTRKYNLLTYAGFAIDLYYVLLVCIGLHCERALMQNYWRIRNSNGIRYYFFTGNERKSRLSNHLHEHLSLYYLNHRIINWQNAFYIN